MKTITLTNDKGNASAKVRTNLKNQVNAEITARFPNAVKTPKGMAIVIGEDFMTKAPIYAIIDPVITMDIEIHEKEKAVAETETLVIPNIFE